MARLPIQSTLNETRPDHKPTATLHTYATLVPLEPATACTRYGSIAVITAHAPAWARRLADVTPATKLKFRGRQPLHQQLPAAVTQLCLQHSAQPAINSIVQPYTTHASPNSCAPYWAWQGVEHVDYGIVIPHSSIIVEYQSYTTQYLSVLHTPVSQLYTYICYSNALLAHSQSRAALVHAMPHAVNECTT